MLKRKFSQFLIEISWNLPMKFIRERKQCGWT
jgi:hypothetical protein